jgi:hypothetical protein
MWPCKLKSDEKKTQNIPVWLDEKNGFGPQHFVHSLLRLVTGTTKSNTSQRRTCNGYVVTAAPCFQLVDHNDSSKWFCYYCSLRSVSTLTKWIMFFFSKNEFVFKFWNYIFFHYLLWYCDMSSEIIQSVAYDNYDDFQHVNFIFSQIFISLSWGLFNDETNLRVRK